MCIYYIQYLVFVGVFRTLCFYMVDCRSCIVGALSRGASRCPSCNLPGWLKDLKFNGQLANMIRLLASMKKELLPTFNDSDMVSTTPMSVSVDEPSTNNSILFDCTSHYDCNSTAECGTNQLKDNSLFLKPRIDASLIKRRLKSSKVTDFMIPKPSSKFASCLHSNTPSSQVQASNSSRKGVIDEVLAEDVKVEPGKINVSKYSAAEIRDAEHQPSHSNAAPTKMDVECPCASLTSTNAYDSKQYVRGYKSVASTTSSVTEQRILPVREGTYVLMFYVLMFVYTSHMYV